jgi:hypothetical protein
MRFQKVAVLQASTTVAISLQASSSATSPEARWLCLHADNARVDNARQRQDFCRENRLRILTHLPYSPDLVPSDFFLFGHVKHCLTGAAFASRSELFEAIQSVVTEIAIELLHRVFDHWLERLDWVAKNHGEYYP